MPKLKTKLEDCSHIHYRFKDSGMSTVTFQRDIGLECVDCGTVWDIKLLHGKKRAYIKVRQPLKDSK